MPNSVEDTGRFLAAVVESSPDAIVAVDLDGRILSWNAAAVRMIGYTADQAIGRKLTRLVPEANREDAAALLDRVRAGESPDPREVVRLRQDGSAIVVQLTVAPIVDAEETVCGSVGIMHDVTERKRVEDLLRRNERLASMGAMAAGIAHEINNPIGGILMAAQYALSAQTRADSAAVTLKALNDIELDARRCRDIVRELLRFGKGGDLTRSPCDANRVIETAIGLTRRTVAGHRVAIHYVADESLARVMVNRTEMEQALANLINNAIEAGSSEVHISASVSGPAGGLRIIIQDDGAGVADELIGNIFDPFFTTRGGAGGTGLGLSLAKAIVTDHGGSLDVSSSSSKGTVVRVNLPTFGSGLE